MIGRIRNAFRAWQLAKSLAWKLPDIYKRLNRLSWELEGLRTEVETPEELLNAYREWRRANPLPPRPVVTVCVATFNRARLLTERCLPSILAQSYSDLEIIVVGDCCTDDTAERIQALNDRRIRFHNLEARGEYPTDPDKRWMVAGTKPMNFALSLATGELVTHLDDDDEFLPSRIEELVAFLRDRDCDFVWHPFWWEREPGQWQLNEAESFDFQKVTTSSVLYRKWFTQIRWNPRAYLFHEPGDWNRFRRIRAIASKCERYPQPLLRHFKERSQGTIAS
jgi:glycosyltransferase involved in cell wall biosynthesis